MCQSGSWGPGQVGLSCPATADSAPGRHCGSSSQLRERLPLAQTRTFLSPEEVLKGLQGEIEEVLSGISLSVSVLKELYRAYDFCCANMKLFFKVRLGLQGANGGKGERGAGGPPAGPHGRVRGHAAPNPPLSLSPLKGQGAGALGIPFFSCLFQDQFLLPSCPDHRGKSDVWLASPRPSPAARISGELCLPAFTSAPSRELEVPPKCLCGGETGHLHLFRLLLPFPLPSVSEQVHDPLHGGGQEAWRPRGELVGLSRKEEASRTGLDT